jgi:nitrilase
MGEVLAGPCYGIETLLTADVDMRELVRARYDLDVVGHYSRPDIFELRVRGDEAPSPRSTLNVPAAS